MPRKILWTEGQDTQIRRLRSEGADWDLVAQTLGLTRWAVIERGRRLGVSRRPAHAPAAPDQSDRPPLPAGHPDSWRAITAGSALEDMPFRAPGEIR
jgi:hypothetical protein